MFRLTTKNIEGIMRSIFNRPAISRLLIPLIFFSLPLFSLDASHSKRVHALIAVDTKSNLKQTVEVDRENITRVLHILSQNEVDVKTTSLSGKNLTVKNLSAWVQRLPRNSQDTIIFYYSGHGTRTRQYKSPWPLLAFQEGKEIIPLEAIKKALSKRNPRLLVILSDCCNSVFLPKGFDFSVNKSIIPINISREIHKLFIQSKGTVAITAAQPGKNALGFLQRGGLMTNLFLRTLIETAQNNTHHSLSWNSVVHSIAIHGRQFQQVPYYEINK